MKIELDMYQTIAVAVVVLMLGKFLKTKFSILERFCIPAPERRCAVCCIYLSVLCDGNRRIFF